MSGQKYTEEFTLEGRSFIYIDLSGIKSNDEFNERIKVIEPEIAKHPEKSVYTITNVENIRFDTKSKEIVAQYMARNKPYVKAGSVIGIDGIKKIMINAIFTLSGRSNMHFDFTKEQAIEWLLKQG